MNTADWKILYLSQDAECVKRQLGGERLTLAQAAPLRDDVSTDEITPVHILSHYDHTLGDFAHTGLRCGGHNPIARKALRQAGFAVLVEQVRDVLAGPLEGSRQVQDLHVAPQGVQALGYAGPLQAAGLVGVRAVGDVRAIGEDAVWVMNQGDGSVSRVDKTGAVLPGVTVSRPRSRHAR